MNLTVFRKGMALLALPLAFQVGFALLIVLFQRDYRDSVRRATRTKEVIAQAHEVRSTVADIHAVVRGAVIARDPNFGNLSGHHLTRQLDALDPLVGDNPVQADRVRAVRAAAEALVGWLAGIERLLRENSADEAAARVRSGQGQAFVEEFRREVGVFLVEEERLDRDRVAAVERSLHRFNALLVVGGVAAVGCTLALGYVFHRGIARRFATMEENARRLAAGKSLPPPLGGADEIARLDRAFRDMAAALNRTATEARDLYDNAPCGYHSVGPDGTVLAANRTELRWLGYEAAEVIGRMRFLDLVDPAARDTYRKAFDRVKTHGSAQDVELELVRKDGTTFPVLLNSSAVRGPDGGYLRSRTTVTDLTERRRAEAAGRLFAEVTEHIPVGLLVYQLDAAGSPPALRVRSGNPFATRVLGVPLDEAAGRLVAEVFPAIPDEQVRRYTAVAESGRPDDLGEFPYGDHRVEERWWEVQAFPLPDRSVGVAFQDVSDRKRAEAEVRRLNADLEQRVRERTAALEAANRDLAQKNAENEMFVYSVSHDLRSPLVNLQGFSKELEKACRGIAAVLAEEAVPADARERGRVLLDGKVARSVGFIQAAVLRLSGIIDALLRLSRAGRVEYRWEAVDVEGVIGQVLAAAHGTVAERRAVVRVGDLPRAWGDRTAIEQVFANLVGNALTYLDPERAGVIEVGCLSQEAAEVPAGFRGFYVRDNGLGIPEAHRTKIFHAFQRAHPGVGSGEGLGLAIVTRVVERHRGRVWVESTPGEGSTFYVALPVSPDADAPLLTGEP